MCAAKAKKSDKKTLENLQKALSMELTATHQYMLHAHVLEDWGLDRLSSKMHGEVQEELGHASKFIDRILFLDGDPVVTEAKAARRSSSLSEMFKADLKEELASIQFYGEAAIEARNEGDVGTVHIFEEILMDEEEHADWLKRQLELIERMGEPNYILAYHSPETGGE